MRLKYFFILLNFSFAVASFAQNSVEYTKKFTEGSFLLLEENYPMALRNFLTAYQIDSSGANINYKIGLCYIKLSSERAKAERFLEKAVLNVSRAYDDVEPTEKAAPVEAYLYLGQVQHINYKFDEAIANFERYKATIPPKKLEKIQYIDHQIEASKNAKEFVASPSKILITNPGDTINSQYPEYSPVISADESVLAFTSRRETSTGGLRTISNEFFEDIFISHKKENGEWSTPVGIDENINTNGNEATINLSADGQQLLIYKDDNGDGNLYISDLEGDRWSIPSKLGSDINTKYWETHACISADGNSLYFVSDRPGGYGGRDIYKCVKLPNGNWSLARNLGPIVNTAYDEDGVFIHPDQVTLFFSSQGHKSMGGFDIFYTSATGDGKWSEPINIGYPINTTDDDIFYVVSSDGKRAYYSSVKSGGFGDKDIYLISLEEGAKTQAIALLVGKIIIPKGETLSPENEIDVTDVESGGMGIYKANTKTGKYILSLMPGKTYELSYKIGDNEFHHETLTVPMGTDYQEIEREVPLKPVILPPGTSDKETKKPAEEKKPEAPKPILADLVPDIHESNVYKPDRNRLISGVVFVNKKGRKFIFQNLPSDSNALATLSAENTKLYDNNLVKANATVKLLNDKGEIVQKTTSDPYGAFVFSELSPDQDFFIAVDNNGKNIKKEIAKQTPEKPVSAPAAGNIVLDAIDDEVTTEMNRPVSGNLIENDTYPAGNADIKVYRGPVKFPEHGWVSVKNTGEFVYTPNKGYSGEDSFTYRLYVHGKWNKYTDNATVTIHVGEGEQGQGHSPEANQKGYYDIYFKYNVYEIDPQSERFNSFISDVKSQVDAKGRVTLTIESSASHVPTRKFSTNKKLAESRSAEAKEKMISALRAKGIDESKVTFKQKNSVQGPAYNHDFDTNKSAYEKYQYVKITAK